MSVQMKRMWMANCVPMRAHMESWLSSGLAEALGLFCCPGLPQLEAIMAT